VSTIYLSFCRLRVNYYGSSSSKDFYIAAAQLEKGAFPTSYIPTTTAAVTRNADVITVPTAYWNANSGTWVTVTGQPDNSDLHFLVTWLGSGGQIRLYGYYPQLYMNANGFNNSTLSIPISGYVTQVGKYSIGSLVYAYVNSVKSVAGPSYSIVPTGLYGTANISSGSTNQYGGPIQRLAVYSSALSDSDITFVTNAIKDGP